MTLEKLKLNTRKELASLAKRHQVAGWHGMRKEELIEALLDVHRSRAAEQPRNVRSVARVKPERETKPSRDNPRPASSAPRAAVAAAPSSRPTPVPAPATPRSSAGSRSTSSAAGAWFHPTGGRGVRRDLSTAADNETVHEELTAVAHDPFWIHARWVLRRGTVRRAEAALGAEWFRAVPVIRIYGFDADDAKGVNARVVKDVEIHGECDHWFVPVDNPPGLYKLEIGYLAPSGRFYALAKSRRVTTPRPGSKAAERVGWNRSSGTSPGMFRPGLSRAPVTDPQFEKFIAARATSYALAGGSRKPSGPVPFSLDTELLVSGTADPDAQLTLHGETVKVGRDGRYALRFTLADGREVFPAVLVSPDGAEQRTIVLAVERNMKTLDPQPVEEAS